MGQPPATLTTPIVTVVQVAAAAAVAPQVSTAVAVAAIPTAASATVLSTTNHLPEKNPILLQIKSLNPSTIRLNHQIKKTTSSKTVISFFMIIVS